MAIALALLILHSSSLLQSEPHGSPIVRTPDIHGDLVAFSCEGDIWLGNLKTGKASRLTRDPGKEANPRFSPDGKTIAFSAEYDGPQEIYTIPTSGGIPTRISFHNDYAICVGWTSDGRNVAYKSRSIPRSYGIFTKPFAGGPEHKLPLEFAEAADLNNPTGFVFTRFNREDDAWFRYGGGQQNQIWFGNPGGTNFKQITNLPGTCEYPTWAGNRVCFVQESNGKFTVWSIDAEGKDRQKLAGPYDVEVKELHGSPDALVYEKGVGAEIADLKTGRVEPLAFQMESDLIHARPYEVDPAKYVQSLSISPTGKRVLVESRGQILTIPAGEGEARVVKATPGVRYRFPRMSPDAKQIAYVSDETGEQQIFVAGADGSAPRQVTKDSVKRQIMSYQWSPDGKWFSVSDSAQRLSIVNVATGEQRILCTYGNGFTPYYSSFSPDSKWIAFTQTNGISSFTTIALHDIDKNQTQTFGKALTNDSLATFSTDGKYLVYSSNLEFGLTQDPNLNQLDMRFGTKICLLLLKKDTPDPFAPKDEEEPAKTSETKPATTDKFQIDTDGLYDRRVEIPVGAAPWSQLAMVGNRIIAATVTGQVISYDIEAKKENALTAGTAFEVSADGKKLLVGDRVIDVAGENIPPSTGKLSYGGLKLQIDPVAEWREIYWDAWRLLRDWFYVENMNGANWDAVGKKYAAMLPSVRSRWELDELIRWLQAELNCSHMYRSPGDEQTVQAASQGGFLGIETIADSGRLKISKIYRGDSLVPDEMSPLARAGVDVKEGDYLLEVGGVPLTDKSDYRAPLQGRAGQNISILVNSKPTLDGAKRFIVKPIQNELALKRRSWDEACRQYVEKASGGKIGYLHLWAMSGPDMSDFVRQFYPQRDKEAMIVDDRFNNGGFIQDMVNRILSEKLTGFFSSRNSPYPWTRQSDYFLGPMACLINEFDISCGEEFPHRFRDLKLGPLIGRRTTGGEVGSDPGWPLVDGGAINVPNYGMWTPKDGWVIEEKGVSPDIDVQSDPNLFVQGHDAQLDKAIEYLQGELKKHPVVRPKTPAPPIRVHGGG